MSLQGRWRCESTGNVGARRVTQESIADVWQHIEATKRKAARNAAPTQRFSQLAVKSPLFLNSLRDNLLQRIHHPSFNTLIISLLIQRASLRPDPAQRKRRRHRIATLPSPRLRILQSRQRRVRNFPFCVAGLFFVFL